MTNTAINNKTYGFRAEAELLQYFRDHLFDAERLHLTGTEDEGDLTVRPDLIFGISGDPIIVQLKTFSSRSKAGAERPLTPGRVKAWLAALDSQRAAYAAHRGLDEVPAGVLIVKFKNTSWDDALVIQTLGRWAG